MASTNELAQIAELMAVLAEAIRDLSEPGVLPDAASKRRIADAADIIVQAAHLLAIRPADGDGHA